ncbi:MAG: hypothetical protein AAF915_18070 [Cyanobacteria bacterium P01_D01_bin.50]
MSLTFAFHFTNMSSKINQYLSYDADSSPLIDEMQKKYGLELEGLNLKEKLYLVKLLSNNLMSKVDDVIKVDVPNYGCRLLCELSPYDQENLTKLRNSPSLLVVALDSRKK